jgi:hypothetical protein
MAARAWVIAVMPLGESHEKLPGNRALSAWAASPIQTNTHLLFTAAGIVPMVLLLCAVFIDRRIPPAEAERLSAALPGSHLRLFPDSGHGLIVARWGAILSELT